jgi:cation transporter-like permease
MGINKNHIHKVVIENLKISFILTLFGTILGGAITLLVGGPTKLMLYFAIAIFLIVFFYCTPLQLISDFMDSKL